MILTPRLVEALMRIESPGGYDVSAVPEKDLPAEEEPPL